MRYDVSIIGLYILDVLGRPVTRIPDRGNVEFIDEIRLTVAGTAGCAEVHVVDLADLTPTAPSALAGWLDRLTTARIDAADEPVTP